MSNSNNVFNINDEINLPYVVKKEARGIDDADFGEVQEIVLHYILTEKGIISKEKFYLPTGLVEGFDGDKLRFNISEDEANRKFKRDNPPSAEEYAIHMRNETSKTTDIGKRQNNKKTASSQESTLSTFNEDEDVGQDKSKIHQSAEDLSSQNEEYIIKKEIEDKIRRESEDKAKLEAERKAQSIQDKAKLEAERKAQSIAQQAEDKAKLEAERRTIEIIQQAEDKAKQEAEKIKQSRQIINTTNDSYPQEESKNFELHSNKNMGFFDPFMKSVSMWQNYSMLWMNLTKEILSNTTKMTSDFENTIRKYRQHQTFD
jgi:hypothetical protein